MAAINSPSFAASKINPLSIAGFPGIIISRPQTNSCVIDIDAAPEQLIDIEYTDVATPQALSEEQLCQGATAVGEEVVGSLVSN